MEEILKALNENKELSAKLKKMWQEKASAEDIKALLKEEGYDVDISEVEEALQRSQNEVAKKVAMEKLDDEALEAVSGGGSGVNCTAADDCDNQFRDCTKSAIFNTCNSADKCDYSSVCDEFFEDVLEI